MGASCAASPIWCSRLATGYVVDHKSFPGDAATGLEKARGFAGQLNAYARALEAAWGKPCLGMFIHLAVLGRVVELRS